MNVDDEVALVTLLTDPAFDEPEPPRKGGGCACLVGMIVFLIVGLYLLLG